MATLALAALGSAIGGSLLPGGISVLGAAISGATIGSQIGALAGSVIDQALLGGAGGGRTVDGPRLSDLQVTASTEGAAIPRLYGRARLGGQIIWATDFDEEVVTTTESSGGGKGGGLGASAEVSVTRYLYYANFAVALCEGPITRIGRVWADGREIELSRVVWRLYKGDEAQFPDSLIVAREGAGNAPAYRGTAYIVFERFALAEYGNRLPQLSFEVFRATGNSANDIRAVVMIPGSGEFVYGTEPVNQVFIDGVSQSENVHTLLGATDWDVAVDQLEATLPNAQNVSLIVSWFGTDLRAGSCQIHPGVETATKTTAPISWSVSGRTRANAYVVSQQGGSAAYGGTPSDSTVVDAIQDLKARGFGVTLTPFILMDVAAGNTLPNPYGGTGQPAYPWRGRITCHPAAGVSGTVDKTAAAATQISSFIGTVTPAHFSLSGETVVYSGPNEWSYRRMVLHQAYLAKAAGGVDAFVIGSELRGLTQVRSSASAYPFVTALIALAADVKSVLGSGTKVLYAADWSEYFGHQPGDGTGDVYFHLDPLWASANIDAIGVDVYWPLADWRDGRAHLDYQAGYTSIHDPAYLKANVQGGEGFDWYYASQANRDAQVRSAITDGAGKPWVFRFKDIKSWWLNQHFNRPGGVETGSATAWVPQSKPFWFMEIGCPAVDKGANQPNVFIDAKSSENALPHYSRGTRDDLIQSRLISAFTDAFDWTKPGYISGLNPVSTVTGLRMADLNHVHVYCWDARPYPAFPNETTYWSDGANWPLGHWFNGRVASASLDDLVSTILTDCGFVHFDASRLFGTVPGYVIDRVMSAREALQPLELGYFFDAIESGGEIAFRHRGAGGSGLAVTADDLVEDKVGADLFTLTRAQETDLPASAKVRFISGDDDYRQAVAEARRLAGASGRVAQAELAIVLDGVQAGGLAESWLHEAWIARERARFALPPTALAIEPGDTITLDAGGRAREMRVTEVSDRGARTIDAVAVDPNVYDAVSGAARAVKPKPPIQSGSPALHLMDLPMFGMEAAAQSGYAAAVQKPWPGSVALYRSPQTTGYQLKALIPAPARIGITLDALNPGPEGRIDRRNVFRVTLTDGELAAIDDLTLYGGGNRAAIKTSSGAWEVLQFRDCVLTTPQTYQLSTLLRGQFGTEEAMSAVIPAGAPFVLLDGAVTEVPLQLEDLGIAFNWRYGPGNRDIGDESYQTVSFAFQGSGLRPLSPAHVKGSRTSGDLSLSWVRRTRAGGDSWEAAEVPLGEESEAYEIDVMQGVTVKRTLTSASPSVTYTAAEQTTDFGSPQASISVRVYQKSPVYGRGAVRAAVV